MQEGIAIAMTILLSILTEPHEVVRQNKRAILEAHTLEEGQPLTTNMAILLISPLRYIGGGPGLANRTSL